LICEKVETTVKAIPEVKLMFTTIGSGNNPVTNATILVKLVPTKERKKSDKKIMSDIRNKLKSISGANFSVSPIGGPGGNEKPVTLSIRGEDLQKLEIIADKVEAIVKTTPAAVDVQNSLELSKPEIRINIDRERLLILLLIHI
jgi:HAE1 family hydrophobic/amphiphilic exporter-1